MEITETLKPTARIAPVEAGIPSPIEQFYPRTPACLIIHAKSDALGAGEHQMAMAAQVRAGDRICCLICSSLPALSLRAEFQILPSSVFSFCLTCFDPVFSPVLCTPPVFAVVFITFAFLGTLYGK